MRTPLAVTLILVGVMLMAPMPHATAQAADAPTYTVSGRVISDAGAPLAGVEVTLNIWQTLKQDGGDTTAGSSAGDEHHNSMLTDKNGTFEFETRGGSGELYAYYGEWQRRASQALEVNGNVSGLELVMVTPPPKNAGLDGRVLDGAGKPIEGATIWLNTECCVYAYGEDDVIVEEGQARPEPAPAVAPSSDPAADTSESAKPFAPDGDSNYYDNQNTRSDADGRYHFESYAGFVRLTFEAKGHASTSARIELVANQTATLTTTLEAVPAADAVLQGKVVDARTGEPLPQAYISVQNVEWSRYDWAETDKAGAFQVTTLPGWVQVRVSDYGGGYGEVAVASDAAGSDGTTSIRAPGPLPGGGANYYESVQMLKLTSGNNDLTVRLEAKPDPSVVLVGYVIDPDTQTGIGGVSLNIYNQDTGDWGSTTTDKAGSYRFAVRPGHYTVNAWAEGYLASAATFTIADGATAHRFDLTMPAGTQKWAPYDGDIRYLEGGASSDKVSGEGMQDGESAPQAPSMGAPSPSGALDEATTTNRQGAAAGATTYSGAAGGLPSYDPDRRDETFAADDSGTSGGSGAAAQEVPALGLLAGLITLGLVAVLSRRRR